MGAFDDLHRERRRYLERREFLLWRVVRPATALAACTAAAAIRGDWTATWALLACVVGIVVVGVVLVRRGR